jgi:diguanylate cyclase (GGDEF)-like protein
MLVFAGFGFLAPIVTFLIATSPVSSEAKIGVLAALAVIYTILFFMTYSRHLDLETAAKSGGGDQKPHTSFDPSFGDLEKTFGLFGNSISRTEVFRLLASRIRPVLPAEAIVLFDVIPGETELSLVASDGEPSVAADSHVSNLAALSGEIEIVTDDDATFASVPLVLDGITFSVLEFRLARSIEDRSALLEKLGALRRRIPPMLLGIGDGEGNESVAFTDPVTGLPNERTCHVVLEHQLAESMRNREERPLSVVAIDIRDFAKINKKYGQEAGDRILKLTASNIRGQLRQMDLLSRIHNDEFVIVLPATNETHAVEVIERISKHFDKTAFDAGDGQELKIRLDIGAASFWKDGETPSQLIKYAQFKKQQTKAEEPADLDSLQKEYVH